MAKKSPAPKMKPMGRAKYPQSSGVKVKKLSAKQAADYKKRGAATKKRMGAFMKTKAGKSLAKSTEKYGGKLGAHPKSWFKGAANRKAAGPDQARSSGS